MFAIKEVQSNGWPLNSCIISLCGWAEGSAACLCIDMHVFLLPVPFFPLELHYKFTWTYSSGIWLDLWHINVDVSCESGDKAGDSTRELLPTRAPWKTAWKPCVPPLGALHIALKGKTCAFGNFMCWHAFHPLPLCSVALQGKELKKIPSVKAMWSVTAACTACLCFERRASGISTVILSASWMSMSFFLFYLFGHLYWIACAHSIAKNV